MRILPMGPHAVLIEQLDGEPAAWAAGMRRLQLPGVTEIVPGAATVLVVCADERTLGTVRQRLREVLPAESTAGQEQDPIEIPVRYDGDDLDAVAAAIGLSTDDVVAAHTAPQYVVAFCGFSPGFGYLRGLDPRLHVHGDRPRGHGYRRDPWRSRPSTQPCIRGSRPGAGTCWGAPTW